MKKALTIGLVLLAMGSFALQANKEKRFSVDLFGCYSFMNPADLNSWSEYNTGYITYLFNYYRSGQSEYKQISSQRIEGSFLSLEQALGMGGRLQYTTSMGLGFSLGLQYQQKSVPSGADFSLAFDDFYQGPYTLIRSIDPSQIWVETYLPTLGIHYSLLRGEPLCLETHLAAGLMLASCGGFEAVLNESREDSGYITSRETIRRLEGSGSGLALEGGLKLQLKLFQSLGLFVEGGYTLQKVNNINGSAYLKSNVRDSNGDGYTQVNTWEGDWVLVTNTYGAKPNIAYPGMDTANVSEFSLDLSGFYLRIGIRVGVL